MPTITTNENADQYLSTNYNEKQYHPTPEQLKVRKARHRRSGSQGSGNCNQMQGGSPRISPLRERKVFSTNFKKNNSLESVTTLVNKSN